MPVCQACFSFVDADSDRCPSCGLAAADIAADKLGLDMLESVEDEQPRLRPTLLLLPIAGIPLVFGLWRSALGTDGVRELFPAIITFSLLGGTSVGGLAYMLFRQRRGYEPIQALSWWAAGLGTLLTPLAITAARFLTPEGTIAPAAVLFGGLQGVLCVLGASGLFRKRTGRRGIPELGSALCAAWLTAGLLLFLPLWD